MSGNARAGHRRDGWVKAARFAWSLACLASFLGIETARAADACVGEASGHPIASPAGTVLALVGDIIIQRPSAALITARAPLIARQLSQADVSFGNFESNSFDFDGFAGHARTPADGPLLLAPPEVPRELKSLGFSILSTANNHAGEWGPEGILATAHTLAGVGLASAGTGADLRAARAPTCTIVRGTSVGLVAITSSFVAADAATADRAGVNALHVGQGVDPDAMDAGDQQALLASVARARRSAALVLVSLHTHQGGVDPQRPTGFERELAHAVIDAGADVFVGHGPHVLRGIEIYKGRLILYSLGNFAVMQPLARFNPQPLILPPGSVFTRRAFFESVLVTSRYQKGRLTELRVYPFELAQTGKPQTHGLPEAVSPSAGRAILERLAALSEPLGTQLRVEGRVGVVRVAAR